MKNKKGFTIVEIIVSFSLVVLIAMFLLQIVIVLNKTYDNSIVKVDLLNKQALISNHINNRLKENNLYNITDCGNNCLVFNYSDGSSDTFSVDYNQNILTFGDFTTKLQNNSYFKNITVDVLYSPTFEASNNALLNINIPMYNENFDDKNFGINTVYQFDTDNANISYIDFKGNGNYIVLNGDVNQTFNTQTSYVEQGYKVYDKDGNEISGNVEIENPLTTTPYKAGRYTIKYILRDSNGSTISQATRSITVEPSVYNIINLVTNGSFEDGSSIFTDTNDYNNTTDVVNSTSKTGSYSLLLTPTDSTLNEAYISTEPKYSFEPTHKYYYSIWYQSSAPITLWVISASYLNNNVKFKNVIDSSNIWSKASSYIYDSNLTNVNDIQLRLDNDNGGQYIEAYFDDILFIDLTETFGVGNEPSQEWCDENIDWFEGTTKIKY